MPFCNSEYQVLDGKESGEAASQGTRIFYRTYGQGSTKVLLIIGLAGTHDGWGPQIKGLTGKCEPNDDRSSIIDENEDHFHGDEKIGIEVCAFDNRGMGRSTIPTKKSEYTTQIMAMDALALIDHLGWQKAHIFGHSMGAMVACKLASNVPHRILSLGLLNVTGGGFECFPRLDRQTISIAYRFMRAKTPQERAAVDLDTHYTKEYLEEFHGLTTRRAILYQEYVKAISSAGMQSSFGFEGQVNACWTHTMTRSEIETIRSAGFLVSVIHGRYDVIAQIYYARRLAHKLSPVARMVDLHGGHLVSHEKAAEVNSALLELIKATQKGISPIKWTNISTKSTDFLFGGNSAGSISNDASAYKRSYSTEILCRCLFYVFGFFALVLEYIRRAQGRLKSVRVGVTVP